MIYENSYAEILMTERFVYDDQQKQQTFQSPNHKDTQTPFSHI
jgi:hypothetical protein